MSIGGRPDFGRIASFHAIASDDLTQCQVVFVDGSNPVAPINSRLPTQTHPRTFTHGVPGNGNHRIAVFLEKAVVQAHHYSPAGNRGKGERTFTQSTASNYPAGQ